ncbi:MAG: hypothetical protein M3680_20580, partial [Myxococcota bacterium]|nr:hypothetical protein [Myxococcota bacterium]
MDLVGLIAVMGAFAVPLYALKTRAEERQRRHQLEAGKQHDGEPSLEVKRLTSENKLLRDRVENLETIVCSVDFELNQKIAKMLDEQRSLVLPAGTPGGMPSPMPAAPA